MEHPQLGSGWRMRVHGTPSAGFWLEDEGTWHTLIWVLAGDEGMWYTLSWVLLEDEGTWHTLIWVLAGG